MTVISTLFLSNCSNAQFSTVVQPLFQNFDHFSQLISLPFKRRCKDLAKWFTAFTETQFSGTVFLPFHMFVNLLWPPQGGVIGHLKGAVCSIDLLNQESGGSCPLPHIGWSWSWSDYNQFCSKHSSTLSWRAEHVNQWDRNASVAGNNCSKYPFRLHESLATHGPADVSIN